jgi:hypothetical protein
MNKDFTFKDFSHFKTTKEPKEIYVMPENPENWEDTEVFNSFGFFNNGIQHVFITKDTILNLYPDIDESTETWRTEIMNSMIVLPSNTLLEITDIQQYHEGLGNLWAFADDIISYKLAVKVYDNMLGDEIEIDSKVTLDESGKDGEPVIFQKEELTTSEEIDDFFKSINEINDEIDEKAKEIPKADNDNVFGNLG